MTREQQRRLDNRFALQIGAATLIGGLALLPILGILSVAQVLSHPILWLAGGAYLIYRMVDGYNRRLERARESLDASSHEVDDYSQARVRCVNALTQLGDDVDNVIPFERRAIADVIDLERRRPRRSRDIGRYR